MINVNANFPVAVIKFSKNAYRFVHMAYSHNKIVGEKPPVIIMHGLFGSKQNWNRLGKLIHQKTYPMRETYVVDARNHGETPHCDTHSYPLIAKDIKLFLYKHDIEKTALLGHSMGGRAMMYFSITYPDLVEKLIVGDISPIPPSPNSDFVEQVLETMSNVKFPHDIARAQAMAVVDRQLSKTFEDITFRKFLLNNLKELDDGRFGWSVNVKVLKENFEEHIKEFPEVFDQFNGPTLFLAGSDSNYIRDSDQLEILKLFPKAEFRVIESAGHLIHIDNPDQVLKECKAFLDKN